MKANHTGKSRNLGKRGKKPPSKVRMKVPSKIQSAPKPNGKLPLEGSAKMVMPHPTSTIPTRVNRQVSQARASNSTSNTSLTNGASPCVHPPSAAAVEEVSCPSEPETSPVKIKEITIAELSEGRSEIISRHTVGAEHSAPTDISYCAKTISPEWSECDLQDCRHRSNCLQGQSQISTQRYNRR